MIAPEQRWRGDINAILYGLIFTEALDDAVVDKTAWEIIGRQVFPTPPTVLYESIERALPWDGPLTDMIPTGHTEAQVRDFLRRVKERLDQLRPWPQPPYLKADIAQWDTFEHARPVATVNTSVRALQDFLRQRFDLLPGSSTTKGLILRLRNGDTVGLRGSTKPGEHKVVLLQRDPGDPGATIASFSELTGFPADKISALV